MATNIRQTNIFAAEDWKKIYTTFSEADFQSYDFETIRKVMTDYLRTYYAEDFNDFIESSEYVALLDLIAFTAQSVAFRTDLNARENFLETAERRDSVLKLVKQLNYNPNRNRAASGFLKINSISTSENIQDINGINLSRLNVSWNDANNPSWVSQFTQILNSALVSGQKIGKPFAAKTINGVKTEQYNVAVPNTVLPIFGFSSNIGQTTTSFEVVSANILTTDTITEYDPGTRGQFGLIYQNDSRGNASSNTGFFLFFKQGALNNVDFSITEKVSNRVFSINSENINNSDVWLYELDSGSIGAEWTQVPNTNGSNAIYNSTARGIRTLYSVNTRLNDQIDLVFGDGSFSEIPLGNYRCYFRVSNGETYRISPADLSNISVSIPYINKNGGVETLTINASLQYTVSNSSRRDLTADIKQKAPQAYYTQNRMVNGEDYNIVPYTTYSDIVKVKSVNRFASGVSRGLDVTDPTGKYTSTNLYAKDGVFYKYEHVQSFTFDFNSRNDILDVINTKLMPIMMDYQMKHFYYENFPTVGFTSSSYLNGSTIEYAGNKPTLWSRSTDDTTTCTGYFVDPSDTATPVSIGLSVPIGSDYRKYLIVNTLLKFVAPVGHYFNTNNALIQGTPQLSTDKTTIWASIQSVTGTGASTVLVAGRKVGAVTLSENIPTGAVLEEIYPTFTTSLQYTTIVSMINYILNKNDFAIYYDYTKTASTVDPWRFKSINDVNTTDPFSLGDDGTGTNSNTGWLILFTTDGLKYTVTYRQLDYIFGSSSQVSFINVNTRSVYDSATNTLVKDNIRVLDINSGLSSDVNLNIFKNVIMTDGYNDVTRIKVTYPVSQTSSLPTDPKIYREIVTGNEFVFYEKYIDPDNLIRFSLVPYGQISYIYETKSAITYVRNNFPINSLFYATTDKKFYQIQSVNGIATVVDVSTTYLAFTGRQNLMFEYQHNAENTRRIDPAATNLIDTYILTRSYDESYRNYVYDNTGSVIKPVDLDTVTLNNSYSDLFQYKMLSDEMILNPGIYKLLFGSKAVPELQANFQVVKSPSTTISDSEVKSRVIDAINQYFALENWDFGETFYFSELSAFLHDQLIGIISSVILVPADVNATFGSLYEIRCLPNEIFLSAATVDNIQVVNGVLSGINSAGINLAAITY